MDFLKWPIIKTRGAYKRFIGHPKIPFPCEDLVELRDQEANDLVASRMRDGDPLLVGKFGTIELACMRNYLSTREPKLIGNIADYVVGRRQFLWWWETLEVAYSNAGLFPPDDRETVNKFCELMLDLVPRIDILGSYIREESQFHEQLRGCTKINIDGYIAPFFFCNPWTSELKGKRVLVVHPFEDSIRRQYGKRKLLFSDPEVLPEFELLTVKAVQSIAGEDPGFPNWTAAFEHMQARMDELVYDVALVGCGSYGLPLAAHAKSKGKKAIHLAGWAQLLFGIYGERWLESAEVAPFINEHWTRPLPEERPRRFKAVENGCYW
jgi:hypothetical protein